MPIGNSFPFLGRAGLVVRGLGRMWVCRCVPAPTPRLVGWELQWRGKSILGGAADAGELSR